MITALYDVLKDETNNSTKLYLIEDFDKVLSLNLLKEEDIPLELKQYIEQKLEERNKAKNDKDYVLADIIREELLNKNIIIKDTKDGTVFEIKK